MSITITTGNQVTISAPGPQGPAGSGAGLEIEDEGVSLTTAATKINFVGAGVTATEPVANEVTVTIPSGGITALTGDVTASGTGSVAAALAATAVTAGSYTLANITVDAKGRITTASDGTLPDASVAYVRTGATGGTVGDAAAPFPDIDTAKAAMTTPFLFDLDNGTHELNLTVANLATTNLYYFRGSGPGTIVNITATGDAGASDNPPAVGEAIVFGSGGTPLVVQSDHSCTINFPCVGGVGGDHTGTGDGAIGGGVSGRLHIKNAITNTAGFVGGAGGLGGDGGGNGDQGTVAFTDFSVFNCQVIDADNRITNKLDSVVGGTFTVGVPNGGTGATTLTSGAVLLGNGVSAVQAVAPGTSGNVLTSNGTTFVSQAPVTTSPAGSGSELQFRSSGSAFGAATRSSVSGGVITLGGAEAMGVTSTPLLTLRNTTAAEAGAQQVSPSIVLEGRGWKTSATAESQVVRFRQNVLPVQGAANPTATWRVQSEINNLGTWVEGMALTSATGALLLGSGNGTGNLQLGSSGVNIANSGGAMLLYNDTMALGSVGLILGSQKSIGWASTSAASGSAVTVSLFRDDANDILALRRGTNAQTFRVYGTYTDASNYRRLNLSMTTAGVAVINAEGAGTGASGNVLHISSLPTANPGPGILWNNAGSVVVGT